MPAAQQQQGQGADNSFAPIWILLLCGLAGWAIWTGLHEPIVSFVFKIKLVQANFISLFTNSVQDSIQYLQSTAPGTVSFKELVNLSSYIGTYLRIPIAIILVALAIILYYSNIVLHFRKVHSMKTLRSQEQVNWPQIAPIVNIDLVKEDIDKGPWAMAMNPLNYCKKHDLLQTNTEDSKASHQGSPLVLNVRKATKIFAMQLGSFWNSFDDLKDYEKMLFAIFSAKINFDDKHVRKLLDQVNYSVAQGKLDFTGVNDLLLKHKDSSEVKKIISNHAYLYTIMASLLDAARKNGVLSTAEILWLKPMDRKLWYILNCVGRQTPYAEIAGCFAHWLAERKLGYKSFVPMIGEAVKALELAIQDIKLS